MIMERKLLLVVLVKLIALRDSVKEGIMAINLEWHVVTMIIVEKVLLVKKISVTLISAKLMLTASNGEMTIHLACMENAGDQI